MICLNERDWRLSEFLRSEWSSEDQARAASSPYNITGFPAQVGEQEGNASACVLELLRWRAGFLEHHLSDVWDVMGEPTLGLDECNAVTRFLAPL